MKAELNDMATQKLSENTNHVMSNCTIVENQREEQTNLDDLPTQIKIEDVKPDKTTTFAENNNALNRKYEEFDIIPTCNIHSRIPCNQIHQYFITRNTINGNDDRKFTTYNSDFNKETIRDNDNSEKQIQRISSDSSDVDATHKRKVVLKFTEGDLPSTDEIKQFVKANPKQVIDCSSSSETENNEQEDTITLFKKNKNRKKCAKFDSVKKFEALPTRIITRVRKPTLYGSDIILKPKYLIEQEKDIDQEIIIENIARLRNFLSVYEDRKDLPKNRNNINKEEESKKQVYVLRKTFKPSINDLNSKPTAEINEVATRKKFKNVDCSVRSKSCKEKKFTKRTRDKKKGGNGIKKRKQKSPKYIKVERETRSKTAHALKVDAQVNEQSKENLDSTVEPNQKSRRTRSTNNEQANNSFASTKWKVHDMKLKRTCRKHTTKTSEKVKNHQNSSEPVMEPRRSRRIRATNDVKQNKPTPGKPKSILKRSLCNQRAERNNSNAMNLASKRLKKPAKFDVLLSKQLRSRIIRSRGLRPLICRI